MPKHWTLARKDRSSLPNLLRELDPITSAPSNIDDLYEIDHLRSILRRSSGKMFALLDNNVVTRVLSIPIEGRSTNNKMTSEHRNVAYIMAYFLYSGIETNPTIAHYEAKTTPSADDRIEADKLFRIYDHLPPQEFADFASGKTDAIRRDAWINAKREVACNTSTQENIADVAFDGELETVDHFYANVMNSWLCIKTELSDTTALEKHMTWMHKNSISDQTNIVFFSILLSKRRLGKMIKNIDSKDPSRILASCKNVAWDLSYLNLFILLARKMGQLNVCLFCSRDKLSHTMLRASLSIRCARDAEKYFAAEFDKESTQILNRHMAMHNDRQNRADHIANIQRTRLDTIKDLEVEIREILHSAT